jgi:hypothetical protein
MLSSATQKAHTLVKIEVCNSFCDHILIHTYVGNRLFQFYLAEARTTIWKILLW